MTAISAINDHYGLKLFSTLLCAYNWPEFIVMSCLIARELRMKKPGYWGGRGYIWWRTGGMNLLFAVFCSHCIFYLDPGFHFYSPDVDECANPRSCPEHSTCHNSLGNYSCACNPGYISRSGKKNFQGPGETCQGRYRLFCRIKSNLFGQTAVLDKELEVEVALSWVQYLVHRTEANSSIHAFIQQTLVEHLLYAKHYSRDGWYCDNTKRNLFD